MNYLIDTNICIFYLKGKFELDKKFDIISSLSNKIDKIYQGTNVPVEKIIKID